MRIARRAGESLDEQLDELIHDKAVPYILAPLVLWAFTLVEFVAWLQHAPPRPGLYAALALIASGVAVYQLRALRRRIERIKLGRDGEREVGQVLDELRERGAKVLHDIVADGFNIDHIVIAPQGVVAIETKTWRKPGSKSKISARGGVIYIDGKPSMSNPIDQATRNADWIRKRFRESIKTEVPVAAVVLFPGWWVDGADVETKDQAWVLNPKGLGAYLANEPRRLTDEQVALAADSIALLRNRNG
jgi:hypothetical protein